MNEVKTPKKPLIFYYGIAMVVLLLLNMLVMPLITQHQVEEVDYGTFIKMTESKEIGQVEIEDNQILFTNKDKSKIYKTGLLNDDGLVQRLYDSGAEFSGEIVEQMSPLMSFIVSWVLPVVLFVVLGQLLSRQLMKKMGGPNAMKFDMGKSSAKVYVQSSDGIKFADVAGEDEAKENLSEVVDYLHNPNKYKEIGASSRRAFCLWALREPAKQCWLRRSPAKRTCRFSPCPARNLSRCSLAWAHRKYVTSLGRQRKKRLASCSSMKSTLSVKSAIIS